jgi:hypothetical protein
MGLLGSDDLTQMAGDLAEVRGDNQVSVVIRRGGSALGAQSVRVARMGGQGQERDSAGAQQAVGRVVVLGGLTLDIQPGDRFTVSGILYEVTFVRPNQDAAVIAEAKAVE